MRKLYFLLFICISTISSIAQTYTSGLTSTGTGAATNVRLGGANPLLVNTTVELGTFTFGFKKSTASYFTILNNGNIGIGNATPTSLLHLKAGTATGNTAPLKFTSGINLTTPESGAMEFNGASLFFTPSATRKEIAFTDLSNISAILGTTNGGTGLSTLATGDILYGSAANTLGKLPVGTNGQVLTLISGLPKWATPAASNLGWSLTGNSATIPGSNFIGTTDATRLVFKTNNIEQAILLPNGNMGIGNASATSKLFVENGVSDQQGLIVRGANSQTGNLQEWQTNTGTIRSSISADGRELTVGVPFSGLGSGNEGSLVIGGQGKLKFYNNSSTTYLFESYGIHVTGDAQRPLNVDGGSLVVGYPSDGTSYGTNNALVAGKVGIGTPTPTSQLHTTGSVRLEGLAIDSSMQRILVSDPNGNIGYKYASSIIQKLTTVQRLSILNPESGWIVYDTDSSSHFQFNGIVWQNLYNSNTVNGGGGWGLSGNSGTNAASNFIGTTDNTSLSFRTNNTKHMTLTSDGNLVLNPATNINFTGRTVSIGLGATATEEATAVGFFTNASGYSAAIGRGASATGGVNIGAYVFQSNVLSGIGIGITKNNSKGISIGGWSGDASGVTVGGYVDAGGNNGTAGTSIGSGTYATNSSVAIGTASAAYDYQSFVAGSGKGIAADRYIKDVYFGSGIARSGSNGDSTVYHTVGSGVDYTIHGSGGYGPDTLGGNIFIAGGKGTGIGKPGDIIFSTGNLGSSGNVLQTLSNKWWIKGSSGILSNLSTPNASAILDIASTTKGFLPPRMTTTEMNAIVTPASGLMIINSDSSHRLFTYTGSGWKGYTFTNTNGTVGNNGWTTIGNTGTNPATNFIGTTDSADVIFKRFNNRAGLLNQNNTSFGVSALNQINTGANNTAIGSLALTTNSSGFSNTALGYQSLYSNTTGSYNIGIGDSALLANTVGTQNVSVGAYSLFKLGSTGITTNVSGHVAIGSSTLSSFLNGARSAPNTAVGANSMRSTTTGDGNTAVGASSLFDNTTGQDNAALGYWALRFNTSGSENLAIGTTSLRQNTTGSQNVGIGREALRNDSSGSGNVGIGYRVGYSNFNGSRNVFIGYNAGYNETGSNKLYIANSSTSIPLIYGDFTSGKVGIGTNQISDTAYKLFVEIGIRTRKVKVDALAWADYVFDKDYKLPTLLEVDKFIQQNKHLPGVQSTADVEKNGIDLGENQATLLKKIEELTLYMIDMNKNMTELNKKVGILTAENELLKKKTTSNN